MCHTLVIVMKTMQQLPLMANHSGSLQRKRSAKCWRAGVVGRGGLQSHGGFTAARCVSVKGEPLNSFTCDKRNPRKWFDLLGSSRTELTLSHTVSLRLPSTKAAVLARAWAQLPRSLVPRHGRDRVGLGVWGWGGKCVSASGSETAS